MLNCIRNKFGSSDKWYALMDNAFSSIFRLVFAVVIARIAGPEVFADHILLFTAFIILQSLSFSYFTVPVVHSAGSGISCIRQLYAWSGRRLQRLQIVLLFILILAFFWMNRMGVSSVVFIGFAASSLLALSVQHQRSCKQTCFKSRLVLRANAYGLVLHCVVFLVGWYYMNAPLGGYWWGFFLSQLIGYLMLRAKNTTGAELEQKELNSDVLSDFKRNGLHMTMGSLATTFSSRSQPFVLSIVTNAMAVSHFGIAMTLSGPLRILSIALQNVLRPRFALFRNGENYEAFKILYLKVILVFITLGGISVMAAFFMETMLVGYLFKMDESYPNGLLPLAIFLATIDAVTSCQMLAIQTGYRNGASKTTRLRWIAAIVNLFIVFPLCYYFGAIGGLVSIVVSEFVYLLIAQRIVNRIDFWYMKIHLFPKISFAAG